MHLDSDEVGLENTHSRKWLFETSIDGHFESDPSWKVVDMDGLMAGNQFWATAPVVEYGDLRSAAKEYLFNKRT